MGDVVGLYGTGHLGEATLPPDFSNGNTEPPFGSDAWPAYAEARRLEFKAMVDQMVPKQSYALRLAISNLVQWSVDAAKAGK